MLNENFRDMLFALSDESVEYLLVGAYALAAHILHSKICYWLRVTLKLSNTPRMIPTGAMVVMAPE
jgi:hypothetical protein